MFTFLWNFEWFTRITLFWDITLCPFAVHHHFGGTCLLHNQGGTVGHVDKQMVQAWKREGPRLRLWLVQTKVGKTVWTTLILSLPVLEAAGSTKTYVTIYMTTWHHIPEASSLHSHCCENPESRFIFKGFPFKHMWTFKNNLETRLSNSDFLCRMGI